jgi:hypothetical protein
MRIPKYEFGDITPITDLGLEHTSNRGQKKHGTYHFMDRKTWQDFTIYTGGSKTHCRKMTGTLGTMLSEGEWWWEEAVDMVLFDAKRARVRVADLIERTGIQPGDEISSIALDDASSLVPFIDDLFDKRFPDLVYFGNHTSSSVVEELRRCDGSEDAYGRLQLVHFSVGGKGRAGLVSFIRATVPTTKVTMHRARPCTTGVWRLGRSDEP